MDGSSTKRQRQEQRQFVRSGLRSTRGQRAVVGLALTPVRPRGVHGRRHQAQQRWRRGTVVGDQTSATPTLHVVLWRRGMSTAQRPLISSTPATTVHCRWWTTWVDNAGSGHAHSSHRFTQLVQSTNSSSRRPFVRHITSESHVSVDVRIISATHECRSKRPSDNAWETTVRKQRRHSVCSGSNRRTLRWQCRYKCVCGLVCV